jgi:succinate-semialdehyde dehydrogenase/glutarate-semialdehyde dehydrogenase
MGDPLKEDTQLGPLARKDLKEHLVKQVETAVKEGAKLNMESVSAPAKGYFVAPQILTGVTPKMSTYFEELFGPVAMLFSFESEKEAFDIANGTPYGLGGAVFSRDLEKARRIARQEIHSGFVAVNEGVRSDPRLAFGGVKSSGYGRELGPFGLHEFVNIKTLNF